jgi:hypothetical protein
MAIVTFNVSQTYVVTSFVVEGGGGFCVYLHKRFYGWVLKLHTHTHTHIYAILHLSIHRPGMLGSLSCSVASIATFFLLSVLVQFAQQDYQTRSKKL